MNTAVILSILACISSLYVALSKPEPPIAVNSSTILDLHMDTASIIEQIQQLSGEHHLIFISFSPLYERGSHYFSLRLEATFPDFIAWYADMFQKIPELKWQHLRLKPKKKGVLVILEGHYGD
ncbi:MAG: hypothetical protein EBY16_08840 [Gammaproteobacteria bacterium]|nr:hypothetical protein [Gammaproteobacteria bacterium]